MSAFVLAALLAASVHAQDPNAARLTAAPDKRIELDFQHYYDPKELAQALSSLATAYPEFLRVESLGKTAGENQVWVVSVGDTRAGELAARPALALVAGLSEGDLAGAEVCLYTIYELVQNHARDPKAADILTHAALYVVPCVDPDRRGRALSGDPAQKSDARRAVELDRNFPSAWDPWSERAGPYPLSEPETRSLVEFLQARGNVGVLVTTASGSSAPFERDDLPSDDRASYKRVALSIAPQRGAIAWLGADERRLARGSLAEFALQELGSFVYQANLQSSDALVQPSELYDLGRQFARVSTQLALLLPRLELRDATLTRLETELWQVDLVLHNSGTLPGTSALGRSHLTPDSIAISLTGGRVMALATQRGANGEFASEDRGLEHPLIDALGGGEDVRLRLIVKAAADANLEISALAKRGGSAKLAVPLK